jgi:uncharacterized protein (DUF1501 family)
MKRREFIKLSASASALGLFPSEVGAALKLANTSFDCDVSNRKLVLIELKGGNDGLNTLIPYDNYGYYRDALRPDIHIPITNYSDLAVDISKQGTNQDLVFNPALLNGNNAGFKGLYQEGMLRMLQSVGYPSQNKSHFASIDLWATGNDGNGWQNGKTSGWMGRFMEEAYDSLLPSNYPVAIQLGSSNTWLGFHAEHEHGLALNIEGQNSENFYTVLSGLAGQPPANIPQNTHFGEELQHIIQTDAFANTYASSIESSYNAGTNLNNAADYPDSDLANQLKTVARLMRGGIETKIYMVTIGGFDTHNIQNQAAGDIDGRHTSLLNELSAAVDAFVADINSDSLGDDVVGLTFSEFGRKAKQNGNLGTDHGEIAPMFVFGKAVQGGISGQNVDLSEATSANNWQLKTVQHDYRQVFATLMQDFLGAANSVVDNAFFDHSKQVSFAENKVADLIKSSHYVEPGCYALNPPNIESKSLFLAYPNPVPDQLFVTSDFFDGIVDYQLFLLNGQLLRKGTLDMDKSFDSIELSSLPKGIFVIHVTNGVRTESRKLIKA